MKPALSVLLLSAVLAVAATDANDAQAGYSNYGDATVDLAAPGDN